MKIYRSLLAASACVVLAGCLVPEQFTASVTVKPDGSYTYKYDGTAVHVMAAAEIKEKGKLLPKDEAGLRRDAEKAAKSPGVEKMNYVGSGRYEIALEQQLKAGQQSQLLKVFTITKDKDGVYSIEPAAMSAKDRDELKSLNIKVSGKAEVYLPSNAKLVSTNASSTPGLLNKAYAWKIGSFEDKPSLRFTLSPP